MALAASGAEVMLREVLLKDKPAELLAASPKATVPVLVFSDGGVIEESLDVMQWALEYRDPLGWLEGEALDSDWVSLCDGDFKHWLDCYKYADRHPEHTAEDHRKNAEAFNYDDAMALFKGLQRLEKTWNAPKKHLEDI